MDKQYLNCTASTSSDSKSDSIKFQFDNSKFDLSDSETSINFGSLEEETFAEKNREEVEKFTQALDYIDDSSTSNEGNEKKICFHEILTKSSKSKTYMEQSSSDLLLKKTTKIMNFNFSELNGGRLTDDTDSKCAAEGLTTIREKKSSVNGLEISSSDAEEDEMVVVNDVNTLPILRNQFFEKETNSAFSELYERPVQSYMETEENTSEQGQKSDFYNEGTVNFFLKKRGKTSQRSKFTQKRVKLSDSEKSVMTGKRVLDSEVLSEMDTEIKRYLLSFYYCIILIIFIITIPMPGLKKKKLICSLLLIK